LYATGKRFAFNTLPKLLSIYKMMMKVMIIE